MKKRILLLFTVACIAACFIPLVGMTVRPTTESTDNRRLAQMPSIMKEDFMTGEQTLNRDVFSEMEDYFNDHFAFRNELIYADAMIQSKVFHVSNVDSVTYGKDGWLFYTSTLGDYLGTGRMTDRQIYNLAHNINLVRKYVEDRGSDFALAIPPNKNTLYADNMPYYDSYIVDPEHNVDRLAPKLQEAGVPYADLPGLFRNEEEILYLKRDSHWNNKGAVLAYDSIMDTLAYDHSDYISSPVSRVKDEDGDLNRMLYTFYGEKELNYRYEIDQEYAYVNDVQSVEDAWIETEGGSGSGTLLMFRDSFGNTLIPLIANQFEHAWFTKEVPYGIETLMDQYQPDAVIFEKVERNLSEFLATPPTISAPEIQLNGIAEEVETDSTVTMGSLDFDYNYYKISGSIDEDFLQEETDIVVRINGTDYEAYYLGTNEYAVFIKKEDINTWPVEIGVLTKDRDLLQMVYTTTIDEGELLP